MCNLRTAVNSPNLPFSFQHAFNIRETAFGLLDVRAIVFFCYIYNIKDIGGGIDQKKLVDSVYDKTDSLD